MLKLVMFYLFPVFQCKNHLFLLSGQPPFQDSSLYAISDAAVVNCPNFKRHDKVDWGNFSFELPTPEVLREAVG